MNADDWRDASLLNMEEGVVRTPNKKYKKYKPRVPKQSGPNDSDKCKEPPSKDK